MQTHTAGRTVSRSSAPQGCRYLSASVCTHAELSSNSSYSPRQRLRMCQTVTFVQLPTIWVAAYAHVSDTVCNAYSPWFLKMVIMLKLEYSQSEQETSCHIVRHNLASWSLFLINVYGACIGKQQAQPLLLTAYDLASVTCHHCLSYCIKFSHVQIALSEATEDCNSN